MKLTNRIALAALAGATAFTGLAAAPALARDSVTIEYRDRDHRGDYRDDRYRDDRGNWRAYDRGYRYDGRYRDRCWTEWHWDGWRHERVPVRVCR